MKRKVMLIYTGGTIGMKKDYENDALVPVDFDHLYDEVPELKRINCTLDFKSFKKPIDSSDMRPDLWVELAEFIESHYDEFDGFVILHGSDTMAYTASALSFMLENLNKAVVLTGSQLPIGTLRTDGRENLITAIEIASTYIGDQARVPEVTIYFEYHLYRGNRARKEDASLFNAFDTPNYPFLAEAGVNISYNDSAISKGSNGKGLILHKEFSNHVAMITLFPGMRADIIKSLGKLPQVRAIIIESFGSGNAPSNKEFLDSLKDIIESGVAVINITQCHGGIVNQHKYKNGQNLESLGVISGGDLTAEAAITKTMLLLGRYDDNEEVKKRIQIPLRGEMHEP